MCHEKVKDCRSQVESIKMSMVPKICQIFGPYCLCRRCGFRPRKRSKQFSLGRCHVLWRKYDSFWALFLIIANLFQIFLKLPNPLPTWQRSQFDLRGTTSVRMCLRTWRQSWFQLQFWPIHKQRGSTSWILLPVTMQLVACYHKYRMGRRGS